MLLRGMTLVVNSVLFTIDSSALGVRLVRRCALWLLRTGLIEVCVRRGVTNITGATIRGVDGYLEGVRSAVSYRACYDRVTRPMKSRYRELKKSNPR